MRGTLDPEDRARARRYFADDAAAFAEFARERGWISRYEEARTVRQMLAVGAVVGALAAVGLTRGSFVEQGRERAVEECREALLDCQCAMDTGAGEIRGEPITPLEAADLRYLWALSHWPPPDPNDPFMRRPAPAPPIAVERPTPRKIAPEVYRAMPTALEPCEEAVRPDLPSSRPDPEIDEAFKAFTERLSKRVGPPTPLPPCPPGHRSPDFLEMLRRAGVQQRE